MYVNFEDLNDYEKKNNKISYKRLINRIGNIYLFLKTPELANYDNVDNYKSKMTIEEFEENIEEIICKEVYNYSKNGEYKDFLTNKDEIIKQLATDICENIYY